MSSVIYNYLTKIQHGHPVNLDPLIAKLVSAGVLRTEISAIISGAKLGKAKYNVTVLDRDAFNQLIVRFQPSEAGGRVGAAVDGNSHRVAVSESLLMFRSAAHRHPVVAVTEDGRWLLPRPLGSVGVIVENLENFLRFEETLPFIANLLSGVSGEIELVFGSGNQVTNKLNASLLSEFSQLYCLFDVDMGGLRMFATLVALLPNNPPVFLAPPDVRERIGRSKSLLTDQQRQEIIKYQHLSHETDQLIRFMRDSSRVLEQETYLAKAGKE